MKKWTKEHIEFWKDDLVIMDNGFSNFQSTLLIKIKGILDSASISYKELITNHRDLNDKDKKVKMITIKLDDKSQIWIYHDMAEYELSGVNHIYEEWGYIKPIDLQINFSESIKTILKLK